MNKIVFGLAGAAWASFAFGAWYDAPQIKATVNIRGDYPSNLMTYMNMSADGQYLMAPLHAENDGYPVQVYSVSTLTAASSWMTPAEAGAKSVFASSTYGTKWKGGAISSAGMVMGSGQSSGVTFPFLALPADSWTKDVNAFACTGFETAGSDGMDFSADGTRLYVNSTTNKALILEYDASALATSHAVTYVRTITTAAVRVRNLSAYSILGTNLVYFGEGSVSSGAKSVYVWDTTTTAPTILLTNGDIAGDITNVKVSGIGRGKPRLYVLTDVGQLFVYALNADGKSLATSAPIKSFTASEVSALCGINGTVITSDFKNFEVTDNGRFAFFAHHAVGNIAAPGICVVYTETENEAVWADPHAVTTRNGDKTVISFTQNGTLTLTRPVTMEVLLVGGGGGGGGKWGNDSDTSYCGGGGGGGGVIHKTALTLSAGDYSITIGAGGIKHYNWNESAAKGTATTAFGFTAYGGGAGQMCYSRNAGWQGKGASGGGGAKGQNNVTYGSAIYTASPYNNLGNNGAAGVGIYSGGGGGGGAGTAASGIVGGDGYPCSITGTEIYYAGGGGGKNNNNGKGGGSACYGGGGSGGEGWVNDSLKHGGPGIVIVSFADEAQSAFADATGGTVTKSHDANGRFITHTFTTDGTFTLPHAAQVEVLLVGGGGGGGGKWSSDSDNSYCGGGGGGGGVIHKATLTLSAGEYPISIGAGGVVHNNWNHGAATGGKTTAFDLTAMGGGAGQMCYSRNAGWTGKGASGGGGAKGQYSVTYGAASYSGDPYNNLGNDGASGIGVYDGGGGGGGAGTAANGTYGGDGYACSITGAEVYYAGGGGGKNNRNGKGGGYACYGGGGCGGEGWISVKKGGSGVVIVRYARPSTGLAVLFK